MWRCSHRTGGDAHVDRPRRDKDRPVETGSVPATLSEPHLGFLPRSPCRQKTPIIQTTTLPTSNIRNMGLLRIRSAPRPPRRQARGWRPDRHYSVALITEPVWLLGAGVRPRPDHRRRRRIHRRAPWTSGARAQARSRIVTGQRSHGFPKAKSFDGTAEYRMPPVICTATPTMMSQARSPSYLHLYQYRRSLLC